MVITRRKKKILQTKYFKLHNVYYIDAFQTFKSKDPENYKNNDYIISEGS